MTSSHSSPSTYGDERLAAHARAADLIGLAWPERLRRVREDRAFADPSFIELSISLGRDFGLPADEREGWARLAVEAALKGRSCRAEELVPLAWAVLGTAHRAQDRLSAGRAAFMRCHETRYRIADPLELSDTFWFESAYWSEIGMWSSRAELAGRLGARGREAMAKAAELIDEALLLATASGADGAICAYQTQAGLIAERAGRPSSAIMLLLSAVDRIDPAAHPRMALVAGHNLASAAIALGQLDAAMDGILRLQHQYELVYDPIAEPRVLLFRDHLLARIARAQGHLRDAEDRFYAIREGFLRHGMLLSAADIDLSLAQLAAERGCYTVAEKVAARALRVLLASGATAPAQSA